MLEIIPIWLNRWSISTSKRKPRLDPWTHFISFNYPTFHEYSWIWYSWRKNTFKLLLLFPSDHRQCLSGPLLGILGVSNLSQDKTFLHIHNNEYMLKNWMMNTLQINIIRFKKLTTIVPSQRNIIRQFIRLKWLSISTAK